MRPPEELHAGKCRCVLSRVGVQDDKAGIHPVFDAAAMTVEAGAFSRTSGQGRGKFARNPFRHGTSEEILRMCQTVGIAHVHAKLPKKHSGSATDSRFYEN